MIRRRLDAWLARIRLWLDANLVAPAVDRALRANAAEHIVTRKVLGTALDALRADVGSARHEIRFLNDELEARPATAEQMRDFTGRLEHVEDQLQHLAALMFGKDVAKRVVTSRGPRRFTYEERQ